MELSEETPETVHLALPVDVHMVYIDKVESRRAVVMRSRVGQQLPLHCSALGKAYLSALPVDERRAMVEALQLDRRTSRTLTDPDALLGELDLSAKRGFAMDNVENEEGVRCVGAAILDDRGRPVAAVSISAPAARWPVPTARSAGVRCAETASQISLALGARQD